MKTTWNCIVRIKTPEGYRSHLIEKESFTIGRTQEADLPILIADVSRLHVVVTVKGSVVTITDQNSANGTAINGQKLLGGQEFELSPTDVVRIGMTENEFTFMSFPRPFELQDANLQKNSLLSSMESIAREIQEKARLQAEKVRDQAERAINQARLEAEQTIAHAKKEAELVRTQGAFELSEKKGLMEAEIARMKQEVQSEIAQERMRAQKEADQLISDAQKRIQKDYMEASERVESQLKGVHEKSREAIAAAESKAEAMLHEAREEASRLRLEASEEARDIHQEAIKKSAAVARELQDRAVREASEKKQELLAQAASEIEQRRELFEKEQSSKHHFLLSQVKTAQDSLDALKSENDKARTEKSTLQTEMASLQNELTQARKVISDATDAEKRREKAEREYKNYVFEKEEGVATLQAELKALREKGMVELESRKSEQEGELAKIRLKALEDVQKKIEGEEKKYEETRRLRAVETSQRLAEKILPKLENMPENLDQARAQMKAAIDTAVESVLMQGVSSVQVVNESVKADVVQESADRRKKIWRAAAAAIAATVIAFSIFGEEISKFLKDFGADSYAEMLIERRKQESIYHPEQTPEFRASYTDNVLYMRGYLETKSDPLYVEKWTLRLNDVGFLKSLKPKLSEEEMVTFVAAETNLVQRLGSLKSMIDALYLKEGIGRMQEAEAEAVKEILTAVKGEENYQRIRQIEREYLAEFQSRPTGDRVVSGSH